MGRLGAKGAVVLGTIQNLTQRQLLAHCFVVLRVCLFDVLVPVTYGIRSIERKESA